MKKITPYIFIALILVNLFAPFTVGLDQRNKPTVSKSEAEAGDIGLTLMGKTTKTTIELKFNIARFKETAGHGMVYLVTDKYGTTVVPSPQNPPPSNYLVSSVTGAYTVNQVGLLFKPADGANIIAQGRFKIGGADVQETQIIRLQDVAPNTTYYVSYAGFNGDKDDAYAIELDTSVKTKSADEADDTDFYELSSSSGGGFLPACVWGLIKVNVSGCIAQLLYAALFQPTAYLFSLAGKFFDFTFYYSINDDSYRSPFVIEGWGLVRDFVNIFFIFVLLWIAFSTILDVHGFKTKEMVRNVVIIGLLINFSLFATQVIIDTSNILARVFYNNISSPEKDKNNQTINALGVNGETKISEQIVGFVNPQKLIAKANRVGVITKPGDQATNTGSNSYGISNGTFILVTILASVVNIVGIFVFVSVGLIFVARVLGLWLAMIFVPLAFFSYTVPQMKGIDMIGWTKWWPDTLKLSFLAPIFIFFMYLIVKFLGATNFFSAIKGESGTEFIISIIFPFAFIMILMMKAKSIASKLAGDIGSGVTKAAVVGGGAALAGGALGAAALGRNTMGAVAKFTQNDSARGKALRYQDTRDAVAKIRGWNTVNPFAYLNVAKKAIQGTGKFAAAGVAAGAAQIGKKTVGGKTTNYFQRQEKAYDEKAHSEQALNQAAADLTHDKDAKYKDLSEAEQEKARKSVNKDELAKKAYGTKFDNIKDDSKRADIQQAVDAYHARGETGVLEVGVKDENGYQKTDARGNPLIATADHSAMEMANIAKASQAMGEFIQSLRKGSYDVRELSKIKKSGTLTAWGVGAMALGGMFLPIGLAIAASTSGAIKKGLKAATGGIDHGSAQKDFLKDLSHTINTALSHMKVDVKVDSGGGGDHGHAKASGGGGHH